MTGADHRAGPPAAGSVAGVTTTDQRQWVRAEPEVERIDLDPSSWVDVVRGLVPRADEVHDELVATVPWQPSRVFRYERWIDEPRLFCWQSGSGRHPALVETQAWISRRYRSLFDGVAVTLYRDEHDGVGFHRDRELRWLEDTVIGVLSMGAQRPWLMRPLTGHKADSDDLTGVIDLAPASGDLLVMGGRCQAAWLHAVPQTRGPGPQPRVGPVAVDVPAGPARPQPLLLRAPPLQPVAAPRPPTSGPPPHAVTVAAMRFSVWPSFQRPWAEVLGSLVSPSSVHHPALLAKQATTVDQVAGGRVVLGVGAGWQVNEHRAYGFELAPPKERVDRFAELIQILRGGRGRTGQSGAPRRGCSSSPTTPRWPRWSGSGHRPIGWWPARRPSWSTRWASTSRPASTSSSSPTSPWAAPRPSAASYDRFWTEVAAAHR